MQKSGQIDFSVLETGKSKVNALENLVSGEVLLSGSPMASFLMFSHGRRGEGALCDLFNKGSALRCLVLFSRSVMSDSL